MPTIKDCGHNSSVKFALWSNCGQKPYFKGICVVNLNKNILEIIYIYIGTLRVSVQTYSLFKQIVKSICNEYSICFSFPHKAKGFAGTPINRGFSHSSQHIKIAKQTYVYFAILARCGGLEPSTYWFVASHSIQLS